MKNNSQKISSFISSTLRVVIRKQFSKVWIHFCFILLATGLVQSSHAQAESSGSQASQPKMVKTESSYEMIFPDGRVAQVFRQHGETKKSAIILKQTENTCEPELPLALCRINVELKPYITDLRWIANPDPDRLNKVVNMVFGLEPTSTREPVQGFSSIASWNLLKSSRDEQTFSLAPDEFVCNDYRWMMAKDSMPDVLTVASWSAELMSVNPESQISENMTSGGGIGVRLKRGLSNQYYFDGYKALYPTDEPSLLPPFISSQIMNLIIASPKHSKNCQVTFEANLSQVIALVQSPGFQKLDPKTLTPAGLKFWEYNDGVLKYYLRQLTNVNGSFGNSMWVE